MSATDDFFAVINANGTVTLLGILATRQGTGPVAPNEEHGNLVLQTDVSSIVVKIFDRDSLTPNTPTFIANPPIASVVFDTLQTTGIWTKLTNGGNFAYDLPPEAVPDGNRIYVARGIFTTTGGTLSYGKWSLPSRFTDRP